MKNQFLPDKLKELRKAHSFTQEHVAAALDIARQTYSSYETGRCTPDAESIYRLAGLYDIPVEDLIQLTVDFDRNVSFDAPPATQSANELSSFLDYLNDPYHEKKLRMMNRLEKELLFYFEKLTEEDKKEMIEFMKIKARKNL